MLAIGVNSAIAGTASERTLLFTFNGSDTSAGAFAGPASIEIDQAGGSVYVVDQGHGVIDKFDLAGAAQGFSSTGSSSLSPGLDFNSFSDVAVDNSATNPGRIYAMPEFGPLEAFDSSGQSLWTLDGFADVCGLAVDAAGHPWVGDFSNSVAREYATSGSPPSQIGSIDTEPNRICRLDFDASGNAYLNRFFEGVDKYEGGVETSTLDSGEVNGVTVDRSSAAGHVFTLHNDSFNEYDSSGALVGTFGTGAIGGAGGIAYDQASDRVYVADSAANRVEVFGPVATGTVPDVTIEPSTEVGVNKATFHGTVNPQGVPNSYHFEWKQGAESSWSSAESSPLVSLPEDSSDHTVSFTATDLRGGREYQVRLVGVNTEKNLRAVSGAETFTTAVAPAPPAVTIDPVSSITTTSAHVSGTIDTEEDLTEWNVQLSSDPTCAGGFEDLPTNTIPTGHPGSDAVGQDLNNLLPGERYCVRIIATNSAGSTTSEGKSFDTEPVAPTQVFTAFAAPRTDTTARLNGYLNPEGSVATYRFEYSADGLSWTPLPDAQTEAGIRRQIIVAADATGLQPATAYQFRFVVENGAGSEEGETKSFETRTTAEMQLPKRGVELVNQPDKGNQNMGLQRPLGHPSMVSEDGETAVWDVFAGAPGGNTGTEVYFISKRTPNGWVSHGLTPPAEEQAGGGTNAYKLNGITPDFQNFIFRSAQTGVLTEGPATLVRVDDEQHQQVLKAFSAAFQDEQFEAYEHSDQTDDGSHVLVVNPEDHQLEEISEGHSEIVSIMPDGTPSECGLSKSSFSGTGSDASGPTWTAGYHRMDVHDASRVYFQAAPNGGPCVSSGASAYQGGIFYRDRNTEETIEVDAGTGEEGSEMIRSTPDGRSLYFLTWLSHSPNDLNSSGDIYRWDAETNEYTCLTCVVPKVEFSESPAIRISEDFSHIYLTAKNQLVPGYGNPGQESLYVLRNGEIRYIGQSSNNVEIFNNDLNHVEMSNDGNVFLFETEFGGKGLTADKLAASCEDQDGNVVTQRCPQVYRYEYSTGSLECLTCKPGGVTDKTAGSSGVLTFFDVSADGSTAAMVTREALLPEDVNNVADVYEWRNGAVGLISDGETIYPSIGLATAPKVYGIDRTGDNIFFSLADPGLTGYEQDGLSNLYDARIGGGFPRPQPVVHCVEESCNGPLEAAPTPGSTNSSAFSGPGNLPSQTKKRKGRCARKRGTAKARCLHRHRKPRHHKRHHRGAKHNRGGAK